MKRDTPPTANRNNRDDRLRAALRANLQRRKAQARARADGDDGDPAEQAADNELHGGAAPARRADDPAADKEKD